jgi:chromosome partitioning protein
LATKYLFMARTITVISQKGGTGKTSFIQNVGAEIARRGERVLLIDGDPQGNLTTGWGIKAKGLTKTLYEALLQPDLTATMIVPLRPDLSLLPSNLNMSAAELAFAHKKDQNLRLRAVIEQIEKYFDYILIDTPPSLGFFTINALMAAREAIIPLQTQFYAYQAMDAILDILQTVRQHHEITLTGIVLTMYDPRNSLTANINSLVREQFGTLVFDTTIPMNVRIAEAPLEGVSVGELDVQSKGARAFKALTGEILAR